MACATGATKGTALTGAATTGATTGALDLATGAATAESAIELLEDEGLLVPALLVAVTVKVYEAPLDKPDTMIGLAAPVAEIPPGLAVTV